MNNKEIAVVVGATGEMGQVIARRLAKAGLKVLAVARSAESLSALVECARDDEEIVPCVCDISTDESTAIIANMIDAPVRMVVHGPGVPTAGGVLEAPTSAMTDAINIKVSGMLRLVRAVDNHLVQGSRLIAIGGHYGFEPTAYAATAGIANAALVNLMRQYSWAYGDRGITAHLIAPGPADTERLARVAQAKADKDGITVEQVFDELRNDSAINAFTTVEQIAWSVEMLLAPEADALAGSTLFMDAGRRKGL
jgi:NAD(P)-dependent dehydrogenase (short-subunit alcohol dehydrogenase family)